MHGNNKTTDSATSMGSGDDDGKISPPLFQKPVPKNVFTHSQEDEINNILNNLGTPESKAKGKIGESKIADEEKETTSNDKGTKSTVKETKNPYSKKVSDTVGKQTITSLRHSAKSSNKDRANFGVGSGTSLDLSSPGNYKVKQNFPNLTKHDKRLKTIEPILASLPCLTAAKGIRELASVCLGSAITAFYNTKKHSQHLSEPTLLPKSIPDDDFDLQINDGLKGDAEFLRLRERALNAKRDYQQILRECVMGVMKLEEEHSVKKLREEFNAKTKNVFEIIATYHCTKNKDWTNLPFSKNETADLIQCHFFNEYFGERDWKYLFYENAGEIRTVKSRYTMRRNKILNLMDTEVNDLKKFNKDVSKGLGATSTKDLSLPSSYLRAGLTVITKQKVEDLLKTVESEYFQKISDCTTDLFFQFRESTLEDEANRRAENVREEQKTVEATEEALQSLAKEGSLPPQHLRNFVSLFLKTTLKKEYILVPISNVDDNADSNQVIKTSTSKKKKKKTAAINVNLQKKLRRLVLRNRIKTPSTIKLLCQNVKIIKRRRKRLHLITV